MIKQKIIDVSNAAFYNSISITTPNLATQINKNIVDSGYFIFIETCYILSPALAMEDFIDTFFIGYGKEEGFYNVCLISSISAYYNTCLPIEANTRNLRFEIREEHTIHSDEHKKNEISVYPNPAKNEIILEKPTADKVNGVLINSRGQVVLILAFENKKNKVDLSNLPNGIYMLNLYSKDQEYS